MAPAGTCTRMVARQGDCAASSATSRGVTLLLPSQLDRLQRPSRFPNRLCAPVPSFPFLLSSSLRLRLSSLLVIPFSISPDAPPPAWTIPLIRHLPAPPPVPGTDTSRPSAPSKKSHPSSLPLPSLADIDSDSDSAAAASDTFRLATSTHPAPHDRRQCQSKPVPINRSASPAILRRPRHWYVRRPCVALALPSMLGSRLLHRFHGRHAVPSCVLCLVAPSLTQGRRSLLNAASPYSPLG
jgi:hypothetical protein